MEGLFFNTIVIGIIVLPIFIGITKKLDYGDKKYTPRPFLRELFP